ncbi:SURF1 family protein [Pontixanthobacter aestiaquae]|uniref:SURF1-like protein n=1 Tax=Pontixanthobacter aestiaquae TaxID=1509367 RepID=A0A844Z762_9SPHN|nr:SURF1 family protein [Pontixanthobacter aestiaquae]MDN3645833.1 SURF1 family protein [Pontixanthobacter aestiaquae]MXO83172.1 SURF1 family protein [Pontixanthobacter aestiaquae]
MKPRSIPIVPTIIVGIAIAIMIALGFWQMSRADEKDAMVESFLAVREQQTVVPFPRKAEDVDAALYRRSEVECTQVLSTRSTAARDPNGTSGLAQVALCNLAGGGQAEIMLGWTARPFDSLWEGGVVTGYVAPSKEGPRLVASPPTFGLQQLAPPDPRDLPNNHMAYAGQWFFFALTALIMYIFVLRGRTKDS